MKNTFFFKYFNFIFYEDFKINRESLIRYKFSQTKNFRKYIKNYILNRTIIFMMKNKVLIISIAVSIRKKLKLLNNYT